MIKPLINCTEINQEGCCWFGRPVDTDENRNFLFNDDVILNFSQYKF